VEGLLGFIDCDRQLKLEPATQYHVQKFNQPEK